MYNYIKFVNSLKVTFLLQKICGVQVSAWGVYIVVSNCTFMQLHVNLKMYYIKLRLSRAHLDLKLLKQSPQSWSPQEHCTGLLKRYDKQLEHHRSAMTTNCMNYFSDDWEVYQCYLCITALFMLKSAEYHSISKAC